MSLENIHNAYELQTMKDKLTLKIVMYDLEFDSIAYIRA